MRVKCKTFFKFWLLNPKLVLCYREVDKEIAMSMQEPRSGAKCLDVSREAVRVSKAR